MSPTEEGVKEEISPDNRLVVNKQYNGTVTIELYESRQHYNETESNQRTGENVTSVTYTAERTGTIHVREFVPEGFVVVYVDETEKWKNPVGPFEQIELLITTRGELEVVSHTVL